MRNAQLALLLAPVLLAGACAKTTNSHSAKTTKLTDRARTSVSQPRLAPRSYGVPHSSNIDSVVLSHEGEMALSRDVLGGVRFWSKLDGSAEPTLMPIRSPQHMSIARHDEGATIAVIDGIGALHIVAAQKDGGMHESYMSNPHAPMPPCFRQRFLRAEIHWLH